jgi:hypothetical protein
MMMKKTIAAAVLAIALAAAAFAQAYRSGSTATVTGLRDYNGKHAYLVGAGEKSGTEVLGMSPTGTPCAISGGKVTLLVFYRSDEEGVTAFTGSEAVEANYCLVITEDSGAVVAEYEEPEEYCTMLFSQAMKFAKGKASVKAGEVISGNAEIEAKKEKTGSKAGKKVGDAAKGDAGEVAGEARGAAKDVVKEEVREGTKKWVKGLFD